MVERLNIEEGIVRESNEFQKTQKEFSRQQRVLELKEQYPGLRGRRYLIKEGLITREEYRRYKGKSLQKIGLERAVGAASIMNDIVG